jgi:VWFA-related protein
MRRRLLRRPGLFLSGLLWLWPLGLAGQTHTLSLQKVDLSLLPRVQVYLTVTDENGQSVLGLTDRELAVEVDGRAQRVVSLESALAQGRSLAVVLVIDRSGSMAGSMPDVRRAAADFVGRLSRGDEAAVVAFDDLVSVEAGFSRERALTAQAIERISLGRDTALYDGVQTALELLSPATQDRQAVVVLSDGKDNRSRRTEAEVLEEARGRSVPLFTIGLGPGIDEAVLRDLAAKTGGGFFRAAAAEDVRRLYQSIAEQLANQYLLAFDLDSGEDGNWHTLKVLWSDPAGGGASTERPFIASLGPGVSRQTLDSLERKVTERGAGQAALLGGGAGLLAGVLGLLLIGLARRRRGQGTPVAASLGLLAAFILLGALVSLILFLG